jgi:mannose-1-phosphate guanylyltransferase
MCNVAPDVLLQRRNKDFDNFDMLDKALKDLLYKECKRYDMEHTVLWMTLEIMKLKATSGWSDISFSTLFELLTKYCQSQIVCLVAPTK